jgi:hypothetical protein
VEVCVIHGHDGDDTFGPDSWWAYWHDNPEDDEAYKDLGKQTASDQQMQECLDEQLYGSSWANRVKFFFRPE